MIIEMNTAGLILYTGNISVFDFPVMENAIMCTEFKSNNDNRDKLKSKISFVLAN